MDWQNTPYALPLCIAALTSAASTVFAWHRRATPGAVSFAFLSLAVAGWSLGYALELSSAAESLKLFWAKTQYLGIAFVPLTWLTFALQYTGKAQWLTLRRRIFLTAWPLVMLLFVWTNERHGLIWNSVELSGPYPALELTHGLGFWIHAVLSYVALLAGTFLLFRVLRRSPQLYRGQAGAILVGALAPWGGNVLYLSGLNPFPNLDPTPLAFSVTSLAFMIALSRLQLLEIVPIARDLIVESMYDAVLVLDNHNRLMDLNPAAQAIMGCPPAHLIGHPAQQILANWPDLVRRLQDVHPAQTEMALQVNGVTQHFDLRISPLYGRRGRLTGRLIVMSNISAYKRVTESLKRERKAFHIIAEAAVHAADIPDLCRRVLGGLVETLNFDFGTVRLYNKHAQVLEITAVVGLSETAMREKGVPPQPLDDPRHIAALVARTREAIFAPDVTRHPIIQTHAPRLDELEIRALISWPILSADQELLGVIHLIARTPMPIGEEERTFFGSAIETFANAIERKRAEHEQQRLLVELRQSEALAGRRAMQLTLLSDITQAAMRRIDVDEMLHVLAGRLGELVGADDVYITLWDAERGRTLPAATSDHSRGEYRKLQIAPHELTMTRSVIQAGVSLVAEDVFHSPFISPRIAALFPQKSLLGVPLQVEGKALGALLVAFRETHHFSEDEIQRCEQAARQVSIAIERGQLFNEIRRRAERLALVNRVSAVISASLDLDHVLHTTVEQLALVLDAELAELALFDEPGQIATVVAEHRPLGAPSALGVRIPRHGTAWMEQVWETTQPLECSAPAETGAPTDTCSQLIVPLMIKGRVLGTIRLASTTTSRAFSYEEVELAQTIANQAAVAIENAQAYALQTQVHTQLQELNQLKTDFLSTAAHELRTPLTSIRGFGEILLTRELDPDRRRRYLTLIHQQATQLSAIIDDLLDISRLEAGRGLQIVPEPLDMGQVLREALIPFQESVTRHCIQVEGAQTYPPVLGDPFRLAQVVKNLLSNAIKFSPDGGAIVVRSRVVDGYLQVSVQDEGMGMTAEQQAHLFEKFYRADAANASIPGTGLGLAISQAIVKLHGGDIWVNSQLGVGTTVSFTLPLTDRSIHDWTP